MRVSMNHNKKVKCATIMFLEELQSVEKMLKREDAKKWANAMQE